MKDDTEHIWKTVGMLEETKGSGMDKQRLVKRLTAFTMWVVFLVIAAPILAVVLGFSVRIFCRLAGIG